MTASTQTPITEIKYQDLPSGLSLKDFVFSDYLKGEQEIIKPQLEDLGYEKIRFSMGEYDSFGPLSRVITCTKEGAVVRFVYG